MKKRFSAWVLALAMLCTVIPFAAAAPAEDTAVVGGVGAVTDFTQNESDNIRLTTIDDVPAGAEVLEAVEASKQTKQMIAAKKTDRKNIETNQVNYSVPTEQQINHSASMFSTYGEQLPNLVYEVMDQNGKTMYIAVGSVLKKIYDNVMADLKKGYDSAIFKAAVSPSGDMGAYYDNKAVQNLGLTVTFPKGLTDERYNEIMQDMNWVLYRCVDFDSTDLFFSNGYAFYAFNQQGNSCKMWVAPLCYKEYETLKERTEMKKRLDAEVASVVRQASAYPLAYDKMKFFHDWLCLHNEYNYDAINNQGDMNYAFEVSGSPWSSAGAMLSHTGYTTGPVCESYSRAFQLLCSKAGIKAAVITSDNGPGKDTHMWSNVRYGQQWTGVDVTWDDSSDDQFSHLYFMTEINNTQGHTLDDPYFSWWAKYPQLSVIENAALLPYYDVSHKFWGKTYIQYVYDHQYMSGMNCVTFGTYTNVTRAQFATILYSMAGKPEVSYEPLYKDVPKGQWFTDAVMWANKEGIATGYASGKYGGKDPITREQIALMLYQYADGAPVEEDRLSAFPDRDRVHGWAAEALGWAVEEEILRGNANGTLDPRGKATRAQCAVMISKLAQMDETAA